MKMIDLLPFLDRGFEEEESVLVYMNIDGGKELVIKIFENVLKFPKGMPERFLNAEVLLVFADKNSERKTVSVELESDN